MCNFGMAKTCGDKGSWRRRGVLEKIFEAMAWVPIAGKGNKDYYSSSSVNEIPEW